MSAVEHQRRFVIPLAIGAVTLVGVAGIAALVAVGAAWAPTPVLPASNPTGSVVRVTAPITNPEPDYLADPDAMFAALERIAESSESTGRFRFLSFSADRTVVALTEVAPGAVDSVALSWGHTVVKPVPMTESEQARLSEELFAIEPAVVKALPGLIEQALADAPGATVERVDLIGIAGPPRVEINLAHPRQVLEPVRVEFLELQRG